MSAASVGDEPASEYPRPQFSVHERQVASFDVVLSKKLLQPQECRMRARENDDSACLLVDTVHHMKRCGRATISCAQLTSNLLIECSSFFFVVRNSANPRGLVYNDNLRIDVEYRNLRRVTCSNVWRCWVKMHSVARMNSSGWIEYGASVD